MMMMSSTGGVRRSEEDDRRKRFLSENQFLDHLVSLLSSRSRETPETANHNDSPGDHGHGEGDQSPPNLPPAPPLPPSLAPPSRQQGVLFRSGNSGFIRNLFWNPTPPPTGNGNGNNNNNNGNQPDRSITFANCGGLEEQIKYINDHVLVMIDNQAELGTWGFEPVKGIIFHGPPGSGKTQLGRALSNELKTSAGERFNFFLRNGSEMFGKYVGETEGKIRKLFDDANASAPAVIFIDELDSLGAHRDTADGNLTRFYAGVVNQLLGCMDTVVRGRVLVIGATNRLESIDPAFRRPGRFDKALPFYLPNLTARKAILRIHSRKWRVRPTDADFEAVAARTVGFTGADLEQLCRETAVKALNRQFPNVRPGQPINLERFRITLQDWNAALAVRTFTNTNVYGLAHYSGHLAPDGVRLLTIGMENDIVNKIRPWLSDLRRQPVGTSINSCIVWSRHRPTLDIVNSYIIPSVVSCLDPNEVVAYRLDITNLQNPKVIYEFMAKVFDTSTTKLLIIPHFENLAELTTQNGLWIPLFNELSRLRGTRVLTLVTASRPVEELRSDDIRCLLSTAEVIKVRNLTTAEAKAYFEPVFQPEFYHDTQSALGAGGQAGGDGVTWTTTVINSLKKGLAPLLAIASDFGHRHQLADSLDMKALLKRAVAEKLTPTQHVAQLKQILADHRHSAEFTMYN